MATWLHLSFYFLLLWLPACSRPSSKTVPSASPSPSAVSSAKKLPTIAESASVASPRPEPPGSVVVADSPKLLQLGFVFTRVHPEPRFSWRLVERLNWQADASKLALLPAEIPIDSRNCPAGMILIDGQFLADKNGRVDTDEVHLAQHQACSQWLSSERGLNGLCSRFDREKWLGIASSLQRTSARFCIDRYEFPNAYGEFPLVVTTFAESEAFCKKVGKRLCSENEWTYACEGEEGRPFPYGYAYDRTACNIDNFGPGPQEDTFKPRFTETTAKGIDLSWRGKRSGESSLCKSPFGVEDMTGNVDEWTRSVRKYGYQMIMKGGHWGPGRHRCRPQTRGHGPHYLRYDQGFRCCSEI